MVTKTPKIEIHNVLTGELSIREMNDTELAQYESDQENQLLRKTEAEAKAQAKATAEGKLAALGLTTDDLRALGLQLVNETLALCSWCAVKESD